ncbi:mCG128421, isoform CRA_b [Mus musculus]|nr:mCG128421, isoform CRA_b [Mus musculus]
MHRRQADNECHRGGTCLYFTPRQEDDSELAVSLSCVIDNCVAAAGFSVGEFAALVFAGAMDFSEGTQEV